MTITTDPGMRRKRVERTSTDPDARPVLDADGNRAGWRRDAACRTYAPMPGQPHAFDDEPVRGEDVPAGRHVALALCAQCPVRSLCLADAMAEEDRQLAEQRLGIRGGLTSDERTLLDRKRRHVDVTPMHGTLRGYAQHRSWGVPFEVDEDGNDTCRCRRAAADDRSRRARERRAGQRAATGVPPQAGAPTWERRLAEIELAELNEQDGAA